MNEQETNRETIAWRGDSRLTEDSLRAHLATVLRLEHIGVLLGAGASVALGGKTIQQLWECFKNQFSRSIDTLEEHRLVTQDDAPNLETLLDTLEVACLEADRRHDNHRADLRRAQLDLRRSVVQASILKSELWEDSTRRNEIPPDLQDHCDLLQKLRGARQPGQPAPWIFTPNYDLAIEWAAEAVGLEVMNGFRGLHNRSFSPHAFDLGLRNTLARGEARFGCYEVYLAKLHGSLTWRTVENATVEEKPAHALWQGLKAFCDSRSDDFGQEMVFPSAAKYLHTIGFVLGELFRRFTDFLNRPQTALIVNGYSFGDEHLNRILLSALHNPTLSLVIYAPMALVTETDVTIPDDRLALKRLVALRSPQVTIIGNTKRAHFSALAKDLPDPAIFDDHSRQIRQMLKELKEAR
ncbi:MAG: hypothetical protein RLZZ458_562 [Planctomycetota bacterium]|jgi:hypothetical protein